MQDGFGASERHEKREVVRPRWPVHVTLRVARDAPYLRKRKIWQAIAKATRNVGEISPYAVPG